MKMKNVGLGAYCCCNDRLNEQYVAILSQNGLYSEKTNMKYSQKLEWGKTVFSKI